jgi:hypothetical protein
MTQRFRVRTTLAGLIWLSTLLVVALTSKQVDYLWPGLILGFSVLGSVVLLIRIMDLLTKSRANKTQPPVLSLGILWFFKLVCLGIFAITLKSHNEMPYVFVLIAIGAVFAPLFGLIGMKQEDYS